MTSLSRGTLYIVATPIGNLQDMTLRGIAVLKQVDRIAAEDTRHARILLDHFDIKKPLLALHQFNEQKQSQAVLEALHQGESIALISDAGTPLISDPGFELVRDAKKAGVTVIPIPGPCALIAAISASGLPVHTFAFEGFLPPKAEARRKRLQTFLQESRTLVFYEAPHRLQASLEAMQEVFGGDREATIARELTKMHEEIITAPLGALVQRFVAASTVPRGEVVIVLAGNTTPVSPSQQGAAEQVLEILLAELPLKQAVSLASRITGERRNLLYEMAIKHTKI
jgi:16S rRNA (cytidine1402-2'-O)-methyltransferase